MNVLRRVLPVLCIAFAIQFATQAQTILYVNQNAMGSAQNGTNWANAYSILNTALSAAAGIASSNNPVQLWIAAGTYTPSGGTDRTQSFRIPSYVTVIGGFAGTETSLSQRPVSGYYTVLSGDINGQDAYGVTASNVGAMLAGTAPFPPVSSVINNNGFNDNSYNVVTCEDVSNVVLNTLIITGGNANNTDVNGAQIISPADLDEMMTPDYETQTDGNVIGDPSVAPAPAVDGGGIFVTNNFGRGTTETLTLINCVLVHNAAALMGGGIAAYEANLNFSGCQFIANTSQQQGGAGGGLNDYYTISNCTFSNNVAYYFGGALDFATLPSSKTIPSAEGIQQAAAKAQLVGASLKVAFSVSKLAFSKYTGGPSIWAELDSASLISSDPEVAGLYDAASVAEDASAGVGDLYSGVGIAMGAGTLLGDMAVALGANPNTTAYKNWVTVSTDFNTYFSPAGIVVLISDITGGNLIYLTHQPSFEDEQYEYMTNELANYNVAPYSTVQGCIFQGNAAQGEGGAIVAHYDNIQISDCWFLTNSAVGTAGAVGFMGWNTPRVFNCAFSGNTSTKGYSAIYNSFHARTQMLNDTLVDNASTSTNGTGSGACVGAELGSAVKIYNSVLWGNNDVESPSGGADIFVATSQNIDNTTYSAYSQAGVGQNDYIATLDLRSSTVQSFNSLPQGTEEFENYPWNATSFVIDTANQYFEQADQNGYADLAGYVNLGEGIRPTDFGTYENGNNQMVNLWGNNATYPVLMGLGGVVPVVNSPVRDTGSRNLWGYSSDFAGPLPTFSAGTLYEDGNGQDGYFSGPNTYDVTINSQISDVFDAGSDSGGMDRGCVQYQGLNQKGLQGTIFYVRAGAPAGGNGTSWATAFSDFGPIIANNTGSFVQGVQIWVAQGTYNNSGLLPANILIYGGFTGNETSLNQRNWVTHPTIYAGQMECAGATLLDGLTITNYSNNNGYPAIDGQTSGIQLTVNNCYFANDSGQYAGAIYWVGGSVIASNCQFIANSATVTGGYGFAQGAAIDAYEVTALNCWFESNSVSGSNACGGAIAFYDYIEAINCVFTGNTAPAGSAISTITTGNAGGPGAWHLYNDTFFGNGVDTIGILGSYTPGTSVDAISGALPTPVNCVFWGNISDGLPPGLEDPLLLDPLALDFQLSPDSPYIGAGSTNDLPVDFPATDLAGNPRLINGRLDSGAFEYQVTSGYQSEAALSGTNQVLSILTGNNTTPTSLQWQIYSNGVWINIANGSVYQGVNTLQLTVSPVLAMYGYQYRLTGVINGTTTQFTPVELISPAPTGIVYVRQGATGTEDGTSWENAYPNLTNVFAYSQSTALVEVWVAKGTYLLPTNAQNDLFINSNLHIYGGFNGTETGLNQRNLSNNPTSFTGNSFMQCENSIYLDGLTFTNCRNQFPTIYWSPAAGQSALSAIINNCTFINNSNGYGGPIYWESGQLSISNCQFIANQTPGDGGALLASDLNAVNCYFESNHATDGGAICFIDAATIIDCAFINNTCGDEYGGEGSAIFRDSYYGSSPAATAWQLYNDTFYGNNNQTVLDELNLYTPDPFTPVNCLFWQNATNNVTAQIYPGLSSDPLFVSAVTGNFELTNSSPAIGTGETTNLPALFPATDLAGNPRITNGRLDAGAYQFQGTSLTPPAYAVSNSAAYFVDNLYGPDYNITVDVGTSGTPNELQWQVNTGNGVWTNLVNGTLYQGVNTLQLTINNPPPAAANYEYQLIGVAANGAYFEMASDTIPYPGPSPNYGTIQSTGTAGFSQSGQWSAVYNLSVSLGAATNGMSLQWQIYLNGMWVNLADSIIYQGVNSQQLTIVNPVNGPDYNGYQYRLTGSGSGGTFDLSPATLTFNPPQIYYVDGTRGFSYLSNWLATHNDIEPPYDGLSWATAYPTLHEVLATASPGSEIWVRTGTYYPLRTLHIDNYPLPSALSLAPGVRLLGGFNGTETNDTQRNWVTNPTIIDCNPRSPGDDPTLMNYGYASSPSIFINGTNVKNNAVLDGFTLTAANNGAIVNQGGSPTIENCIIVSNTATMGAAMGSWSNASPVLMNCVLTNNLAQQGALYFNNATGLVENCLLANNNSLQNGTVYGTNSMVSLVNSAVVFNTASGAGGIVSAGGGASLVNSILWDNSGAEVSGSGTYLAYSCVQNGGTTNGNLAVDPIFDLPASNNFQLAATSPLLAVGSTIAVAGLSTDLNGNPRIVNGKIDVGPYEYQGASSTSVSVTSLPYSLDVTNLGISSLVTTGVPASFTDIEWEVNTGPNGAFVPATNSTLLDYSTSLSGNIATLFLYLTNDVNNYNSLNGVLYRFIEPDLNFTSPPALFTIQIPLTLTVNAHATGTIQDGRSWATAFTNLNQALAFAATTNVNAIWIAQGTYALSATNATLKIPLYGGFAGGETLLSQRNWSNNVTALTPNGYAVASTLDGFTISSSANQNGFAVDFASPAIENCVFEGGSSEVTINGGLPVFDNCVFSNATAGLVVTAGNVTVTNCTFTALTNAVTATGNAANIALDRCCFIANSGSGVQDQAGAAISVRNSLFTGNTGDAIVHYGSQGGTMSVINCTLTDNTQPDGAITLPQQTDVNGLKVANSILWNNFSTNWDNDLLSYPEIFTPAFTAVYGNADVNEISTPDGVDYLFDLAGAMAEQNAGQNGQAALDQAAAAQLVSQDSNGLAGVSYNCIQGLAFISGHNNLNEDPLFTHPDGGNYLPGPWSPAQDAGNSSLVSAGDTDFAGNPRVVGPAVDLGAYEVQTAALGVVGFVSNPQSVTVSVPGSASFTTVVDPRSSLTNYVWQINNGSGWTTVTPNNFLAISNNANASTLIVNPVDLTLNGLQVRLAAMTVTNISTPATLNVTLATPFILMNQSGSLSAVLPIGTDASTYVWQYNSGSGWVTLTNGLTYEITYSGNTSTLTILSATPAADGQYQFVSGSGSFTSTPVTFTTYVPPVLFVNPAATGDDLGTNWANAFTNLNTALATALPGEQIWVIAGTYTATNSTGGGITWPIDQGVQVYGGFAGTETNLTQQNLSANTTILVAGPNASVLLAQPGSSGGNNPPLLEGFIVTGGNGQPALVDNNLSMTVQDCTFSNNAAGAASLSFAPVTTFDHCVFTANSATNGGAIQVVNDTANFYGCQFLTNSAQLEGGAMYAELSATIQATNCVFAGNTAGDDGGAINCGGVNSRLYVSVSTLVGNSAANGGAIYAYYGGQDNLMVGGLFDDLVANNHATGQGGGIYWNEPYYGGLSVANSTIANNTSGGQGGGMCELVNRTTGIGGRYYNCVFWGNSDQTGDSLEFQQIYDGCFIQSVQFAASYGYPLPIYVEYFNNIIQGLNEYAQTATIHGFYDVDESGNLGLDPMFANPTAGNFQLQSSSPAINAGNNGYANGYQVTGNDFEVDLLGDPRIYGGTVDIGAYEVQTNQTAPFQNAILPVSQSICNDGYAVTFTLNTTGPLNLTNVVWQIYAGNFYNINQGAPYSITTTATNSSLTISPVTANFDGATFRVAVAGYQYTSPNFTLTLNPETIVYVNHAATGANNGTDWADAYTNLQEALSGTSCSQIWVAQGTYTIPTGTNDTISYSLHRFLDVRGGFIGTETNVNQRDYVHNPTILMATNEQSIFFNDGASDPIDYTAILDGFILTGATVNPAIYNLDAAPTIRNCVFTNNVTRAIVNEGITTSANAMITNCVFVGNSGGGILVNFSSPTISGCSFMSNSVAGFGGGIENEQGAPVITNCFFQDNVANIGGGFYNNTTNTGTILLRDTFVGNSASQGGALDNTTGSILTVRDSLLVRNSALVSGGAAYDSGTLTAVNDTIADNIAVFYAGGVWVDSGASFNVFNSILWNNSVNVLDGSGVAVQVTGGTPAAALAGISNSIVEAWPTVSTNGDLSKNPQFVDEPAGDYLLAGNSPAVDAGNVNMIQAGELDLAGNVREQRNSVDLGAYEYLGSPTTMADISVMPQSATVCASNNVTFTVAAPAVDNYTYVWQQKSSDGNFTNLSTTATESITSTNGVGTMEISNVSLALSGSTYQVLVEGSSETVTSAVFTLTVNPRSVVYVNSHAASGGNGSSWSSAFVNLADAVNQGGCADIWIAGGVYTPTNDTSGQAMTLQLAEGVRLFGGFAGTETSIAQRNVVANPTILVAPNAAPVLEALGHSQPIDQSTLVDGLTITGGSIVPAVLLSDASPLIQNCIFMTNSAGAALCQGSAAAVFANCAFRNNIGSSAVQVQGAAPTFMNCVFAGNQALANQSGGAIAVTSDAGFTVQNCVFTNNTAAVAGGAISVDASTATISSSVFADNSAASGGALSDSDGATLALINDTIADNSASSVGGVVVTGQDSLGAVTNCIFWNNGDSEAAQLSGNLTVAYSDIEDLNQFAGNANISNNPLFVNEASEAYTLQTGSPCIDLGDNAAVDSSLDLAGNSRIQGYAVDMGAYESSYTAAFAQITLQPVTTGCLGDVAAIMAVLPINAPANLGGSLIWQVNSGSGFTNLPLTGIYSVITNADSSVLVINNTASNLTGLQFRVAIGSISGLYSSATTLTVLSHRIIYVNNAATGNNNGSDWVDAYTSLDAALAGSDHCTEIWVATGNYTSANPVGGPGFNLISAEAVYGGFAGTETSLSQRNWTANPTVLTGSVQTNVVEMTTGGILDGFIISDNSNMGGVYIAPSGTAVIQNCVFPGIHGSAVVNANTGGTLLQGCTLTNGSQTAVINEPGSTLTVSNCVLNDNLGGAIQNQDGLLTVSYSSFIGNLATNGSAIYSVGNDSPVVSVEYCIFASNSVSGEGTLWNGTDNTLTVINSLFNNNNAAKDGAGVTSYGKLTILSSTLAYNTAGTAAAGINCPTGTAAITNSILWGDTVNLTPAELSGAVTTWYDIIENGTNTTAHDLNYDPVFTDPATGDFTLSEYSPAISAGYIPAAAGIAEDLAYNARVASWGLDLGAYQSSDGPSYYYPEPLEISAEPLSTNTCPNQLSVSLTFTASGNQQYYWALNAGYGWFVLDTGSQQRSGYIGSSPYYITETGSGSEVSYTMTISQLTTGLNNYQFAAANSAGFIATPSTVTIGSQGVLYVNALAAPGGDGQSWATAFNNLQSALNTVSICQNNIWVAAGTYSSSNSPGGTFEIPWLTNGVCLYGGFNGTETSLSQRNWLNNPTILSGQTNGSAVVSFSGASGVITNTTTLDGFIVSDGSEGIVINQASPLIANSTVESNDNGGVIITSQSYPTLSFDQILANTGPNGGGVTLLGSSLNLQDCTLQGNSGGYAGAIYASGSPRLSVQDGLITGNAGVALALSNSPSSFINVTIAGNGSGVAAFGALAEIFNCIVWGNGGTDDESNQMIGDVYPAYSCIDGVGNSYPYYYDIDYNPLFVAPLSADQAPVIGGNYHVYASSPVIAAGITSVDSSINLDLNGNSRVVNYEVDQGAYEFTGTPVEQLIVNPESSITATNTTTTTISANIQSGEVVSYQWQINNGNGWVNLTEGAYNTFFGTTTATLTIVDPPLFLNGAQYRVIVTDIAGATVAAAPGKLTVENLTVYVSPTGSNTDGSSWATAFTNIQTALANLTGASGQQIWVAAGSYSADRANTNSSFQLPANAVLLGGFNGTETSASQRNWNTNLTVLEGALPGGGKTTTLLSVENVAGVTVDGFTLRHAVTAIAATNAALTLSNCVLTGNSQAIGAQDDTLLLASCVVSHNSGTAVAHSETDASIINCTFVDNSGIALYNGEEDQAGSIDVEGTLFINNGVGAYTAPQSVPVFEDCTFEGNTNGLLMNNNGQFYWNNQSGFFNFFADALVDNCQFYTNSGSAIQGNNADILISRCQFRGNNSPSYGGAVAIYNGYVQVVDSLFSGNYAAQGGGAICQTSGGSLTLNNCTIADNGASGPGGGILSSEPYNYTSISNCIFWENYGPDAEGNFGESTYAQFYDGNYGTSMFPGANNEIQNSGFSLTQANPAFVQPIIGGGANAPTVAGDFHLGGDSALIGAGNPASIYESGGYWEFADWDAANPITSDLNGNSRMNNGAVDLGAYEYQGTAPTTPLNLTANPASLLYDPTDLDSDVFAAAATGADLSYQWYVNFHNGQGFVELTNSAYFSGVNTATLNLGVLPFWLNDAQFVLEITSSLGGSVYTVPVTLAVNPNRWYVNAAAPAGGDGTSWATAYKDLGIPLANTNLTTLSIPQIWVAAGNYMTNGGSWTVPAGVALIGGFAGTETNLSQRNINVNVTVLSSSVILNDRAKLDGFILNETNASTAVISYPDDVTNAPKIANCTLIVPPNGSGIASGAEFTKNCLTLTNCFIDGGSYGVNVSSPLRMYSCTISNYQVAGASFYHATSLTNIFEYCVFSGSGDYYLANAGLYEVAYNTSNAPDIIDGCVVVKNQYGFLAGGTRMVLCVSNSTISANSQGGIYAKVPSSASLILDHTIMSGNSPAIYGGSISNLLVNESLIAGNYGTTNAGAINGLTAYQGATGQLVIKDSTIVGNYSTQNAGAIAASGDNILLTNSIIWGNGDNGEGIIIAASVAGSNNCVQAFSGGFASGGANLSVDPQFVNAIASTFAPTSAGDYQLTNSSPLRAIGNPSLTLDQTDLAGHPRLAGAEIDLGAYQTSVTYSFGQSKWSPTAGFQINLTGSLSSYSVQWSTNLIDWTLCGTFSSLGDGKFQFTDPDAANHLRAFYRVISP